jgi:hypothetical protein
VTLVAPTIIAHYPVARRKSVSSNEDYSWVLWQHDKKFQSNHSLVMISSRFSNTRATAVQAASRSGATSFGNNGAKAGLAPINPQTSAVLVLKRPIACCRNVSSSAFSSTVGFLERLRRKAKASRCSSVVPPCASASEANARAHSRNNGSLSVVKACRGVFERVRRTHALSPFGASKV